MESNTEAATQEPSPDPETGKFNCPSCQKSFPLKPYLKDHISFVHEKLHRCGECGKEFGAKVSLTLHITNYHTAKKNQRKSSRCTKGGGP